MVKPIGARCNLQCRYCFYLDKEGTVYPGGGVLRMSDATLETFIRDYIAAQPAGEVGFAWQGGEPTLMGLPFFERVVELQRRYAAGRTISNSLQTNGTLLDEAWGAFLAREGFLVGLSLDGPRELHDGYRVDRRGQPTWEQVMRGLKVLRRNRVTFNTLTVLHRRNVRRPREVYEFLRAEGSGFLQFIPLVERRPTADEAARGLTHAAPPGAGGALVPAAEIAGAVAPECPAPEDVGGFLTSVFDLWVRRDVGRVFVQLFDVTLSAWVGQGAPLCVFQEECGRALALEHNGDVFACDHYVYPDYRLGNVHTTSVADLGHGAGAAAFGRAKSILPSVCRACPVKFVCNGDCPKHRFVATAPGEPGVSYLCAAYKRFFTHVRPAMDRMGALVRAGRPAAEIMADRGVLNANCGPGKPRAPR